MSKLTKEMIQELLEKDHSRQIYDRLIVRQLAVQLLEEIEKPKVWDGAPDGATVAEVFFSIGYGIGIKPRKKHTRELPKTREQEIAEEATTSILMRSAPTAEYLEKIVEKAIIKARKEWEAGR